MLFPYTTKVVEYQVTDKRTNKQYKKIRFNTRTRACFNKYRDLFYADSVKRVPEKIRGMLVSDLALAVWFLDDGAKRVDSKAFRLHTNDYPLPSVKLLQRTLFLNYGITCQIQKQDASRKTDGRGYILAIPSGGGEAERFSAIVRPLVAQMLPSMLYKFF